MTSVSSSGVNKMVCDMDDHGIYGEMKQDAFSVSAQALESNQEEKDISRYIKNHFDSKYGPNWVCIVGSDFKMQCTHESKTFIFHYVGKTAICLYKLG